MAHRSVIALLSLVVLAACSGCASTSGGQALSVRRVYLMAQPPVPGTSTTDPSIASGTERFSAAAKSGYFNVVFNDSAAHTVQFAVLRDATTSVYKAGGSVNSDPRPWDLGRAMYFTFPIAGTLTGGRYRLDVAVDGVSAGNYPFTVE
jgi:hypothetical protein